MHDEQPEQGRGVLPAVALGGAVVGAICAVGLTYAGARVGSPLALRVLFAVWVCSPFAALLTGRAIPPSPIRAMMS
jgi:phosphate/sulfate permease